MAFDAKIFENLGVDFSQSGSPIKGIESAIKRISFDISEEFRQYLETNNISATRALSQSIGADPSRTTVSANGAEIVILADDYFKFINEGVDGVEVSHGSPYSFKTIAPMNQEGIQSIKQWIPARGLPMFASIDSMAYAISVGIKKKGIQPKKITENVLEGEAKVLEKIERSLELALGTAVEVTLINTLRA